MDTDDPVDKYESGETVEDASFSEGIAPLDIPAENALIVDPEKKDIYPRVKSVLTAYYPANVEFPPYWAELEVEYSWNASGTSFTCNALNYRVTNNGRKNGNIILGFYSTTAWQPRELSNDDAIQDGDWHPISGGGSVQSDAKEARINFQYIFDLVGSDPWGAVERTLTFTFAPPTITNPGVVWTAKPTLQGTGIFGANVKLYQSGVGTIEFGTANVQGTNKWTALLNQPLWMADPFTMTALQTLMGTTSDWATPVSFAVLFKPIISNIIVSADGLTVSGTGGLKDATLEIWHQGGGGGVQLTTTVQPSGFWSASATAAWPPGTYSITAKQIGKVTQQSSDWADGNTFTVKPPKPAITDPPNPAAANQALTITGVYAGAVTLKMRTEAGDEIAGTFSPSGTSRTFTPATSWAVGTQRVKVEQTVNGVASDPSNLTTVAVKPPTPAITAPPNPATATQVLTITGLYSSTVTLKMLTEFGLEIAGTFSTTGTTSTFTPTENWAMGTQKVKVVQTVDGVASAPSDMVTLTVKPAKPVIAAPPNPTPANQVLTITGVYSGTVTLKMSTEGGTNIPGTFSTSGTSRTFTPMQSWAPGTNKVKVVQTVDGMESEPSDVVTLAVQTPPPAITAPPNPAPANQVLTITRVYFGTVTLEMLTEAGIEIPGTFVTTGNTSLFTPTENWAVGTQKVKVVQTVNGAASDPSDMATLTVNPVKPAKPTITAPPNPAAANQMLTITGVDSGAVTLEMLTEAGDEVAGTFSTSGTTRTFTPTADWPVGTSKVKVVQTVGGVASDPSELATLAVKPPPPSITNPVIVKTALPTLDGTGVFGATVNLYASGVGSIVLATADVLSDNTWTAQLTEPLWMADPFSMTARQTLNNMTSDWATTIDFAVLFKPIITTITVPADGKPTVSGTGGLEGATIDIRFQGGAGGTQLTTSVEPDGSWSVSAETAWAAGTHSITAKQIGPVSGQSSDWSDHHTFTIKPPKPAITPPPNPATARQVLTITGVYSGTVTLEMLTEAGDEVAGTFATTGTTSLFTPTADWAPGPHEVKVVQTVNEVASDPSDVCTFTIEVGDKPEAPHFELPLPGSKTSTHPTIRVTGQPLALMTVRREGSDTLHSGTADPEGVLEFVVTAPLVPGLNVLEVKQQGDGPESDWSEPHRFTVKELPQTPVIDAPTPGSPNPRKPTIRGKGETRGQILLRHEDDPEHLIGTLEGVTSWRWIAQAPWDMGHYTIQVQQTDDGDSSPWSEPRTFEVVDALYGIGDAGLVLTQPVLSRNESVLLRVQVVSGVTGEAVAGAKVEWRRAGEQAVMATTVSGPDGWADYRYTPGTAGKQTVLADLTSENQGVAITQPFEVTALLDDA
ncbi:hypothetical protein HX890_31495 [Pseudomonas gingeri]|uniref:hypothetical protein n=1 Tax=Pseudomonas gingeri TaxID=117681 RepID=UPI0015A2B9FF|nr:hypothetical protein [Pseudomonas gingeri]NWD78643.1 hypothetical protein [Pseudomonas gingeri]